MGRFVYDGSTRVEIEDRTLMHLQIVVGNKLRRGEPFYFTWADDISTGGGRTTVWVHSGASLQFKFHGSRVPQINPKWVEALLMTANSASGLVMVREPANGTTASDQPEG